MNGFVILFTLIFDIASGLQQGDAVELWQFRSNQPTEKVVRYSAQLEQGLRVQSGYEERRLLRSKLSTDVYVQLQAFTSRNLLALGKQATSAHYTTVAFNNLVSESIKVSTFGVIRISSLLYPNETSASAITSFVLEKGVTDQSLLTEMSKFSDALQKANGFMEVSLLKADTGDWALVSFWISSQHYESAMISPSVVQAATSFYSLTRLSSQTTQSFDVSKAFPTTRGTPTAYVLTQTYRLLPQYSISEYLESSVEAEFTLRSERGYIGRNVMKDETQGYTEWYIEWTWENKQDMLNAAVTPDSIVTGQGTLDINNMINMSTYRTHEYIIQASFYPAKTLERSCGTAILVESFQLASGYTTSSYLAEAQNFDELLRLQGFGERELMVDSTGNWISIGAQWNSQIEYNHVVPALMNSYKQYSEQIIPNPSALKVYQLIKSFFISFPLDFSCETALYLDPAVASNATWSDPVFRRNAPQHQIHIPPPGIPLNGKLLVLLPHYGQDPSDYYELLSWAVWQGYISLGLAYENGIDVPRRCIYSSDCFSKSWTDMINGADPDDILVVDTDANNAIISRLTGAVSYLVKSQYSEYFHDFLAPNGKLVFSKIVVVGDKMGGSVAVKMGKLFPLDRVVALNGPVDESSKGNLWMTETVGLTNNSQFYGTATPSSKNCRSVTQNLKALSMVNDQVLCISENGGISLDDDIGYGTDHYYHSRQIWSYTFSQCSSLGYSSWVPLTKGTTMYCDAQGGWPIAVTNPVFSIGHCSACNEIVRPPTMMVSPFGHDFGACSSATPCRSITYAINQAIAESIIQVAAGTYVENVIIPANKTGILIVGEGTSTIISPRVQPDNHNYAFTVRASSVTLSDMSIKHINRLATSEDVGVLFEATASDGLVQRITFTRASQLDTLNNQPSIGINVAGALGVGVFDNTLESSYTYSISLTGSRSSIVRNTISHALKVGILLSANSFFTLNNTIASNQVSEINGNGIEVQGDRNTIRGNTVEWNQGYGITVCGPNSICQPPFAEIAEDNIVENNKIGWNGNGFVFDAGNRTVLRCLGTMYDKSSCTPYIYRVHNQLGFDATCLPNSGKYCKTIQGAINKTSEGAWVILESSTFTENVMIHVPGVTVRGASLTTRPTIQPITTSKILDGLPIGPVFDVMAPRSVVEFVSIKIQTTQPAYREVGILVRPTADHSRVRINWIDRVNNIETTSPGSRGLLVLAPNVDVQRNTFRGYFQDQIDIRSNAAWVYQNQIESSSRNGIIVVQDPILADNSHNEIIKNTIINAAYDGIQVQTSFNYIAYNTVQLSKGLGLRICRWNGTDGCNWAQDTPGLLVGVQATHNTIIQNRLIRNVINFEDQSLLGFNNKVQQFPVYEPLGITDTETIRSSDWLKVSPSRSVVNGSVPISTYGYWPISSVLYVKLAAGPTDCYGTAPGTEAQGVKVDTDWKISYIGTVNEAGTYRVCYKHRQDWEPSETIITVEPINVNDIYYGAPSCASAIRAKGGINCGCYFKRGSPSDIFNLPIDVPLNMMTNGDRSVWINQGCCSRGVAVRDKNILDARDSSEWGLCRTRVTS